MSAIDKETSLKLVSDPHNPYHRIVREFLLTAPTVDAEPVRHGQHDEDKPLTNGDRIRQMTDEELAKSIGLACKRCVYFKGGHVECSGQDKECTDGNLEWLKQEVSLLDRLAAEYDRKHPNGLKFTYSLDGEVQQTEQEEKKNG